VKWRRTLSAAEWVGLYTSNGEGIMRYFFIVLLVCLPGSLLAGKKDLVAEIEKDMWERDKIIQDYLDFFSKYCKEEKTPQCAAALHQIAELTYKNEMDGFRIRQIKYDKALEKWENEQ
jgi:hypothetical protein